jgi:hypothetical protein
MPLLHFFSPGGSEATELARQAFSGFVLALCAVLLAIVWLRHPVWLFQRHDLRVGNDIVSRADAYRTQHNGELPESLRDIGLDDQTLDVYYRKVDGNEYQVWFGTTLGESEVFNSRTKKWE